MDEDVDHIEVPEEISGLEVTEIGLLKMLRML